MKKIYLLQTGDYNKVTNKYEFYDVEAFSSKKKMLASVENRMVDCNKGYDIVREDFNHTGVNTTDYSMVSYKCLSTDGKEMRIRYLLKVKIVQ